MPNIEINMMAVLIAVVANFFLGFIWYTPLFGKAWAKEMGFDTSVKPTSGQMAKGMIIMVIGNFLMAYVFSLNIAAWNPETWGLEPSPMSYGAVVFFSAFYTWLGFYVPVDLSAVSWENKSWKLFAINTGYHFAMLLVAAAILTAM